MTLTSRSLLLATALLAVPGLSALAQGVNNYGENNSSSATRGTADNPSKSGAYTADTNAAPPAVPPGATNSHTPGGTGDTVVPGSNSTIAGDAAGTAATKLGSNK